MTCPRARKTTRPADHPASDQYSWRCLALAARSRIRPLRSCRCQGARLPSASWTIRQRGMEAEEVNGPPGFVPWWCPSSHWVTMGPFPSAYRCHASASSDLLTVVRWPVVMSWGHIRSGRKRERGTLSQAEVHSGDMVPGFRRTLANSSRLARPACSCVEVTCGAFPRLGALHPLREFHLLSGAPRATFTADRGRPSPSSSSFPVLPMTSGRGSAPVSRQPPWRRHRKTPAKPTTRGPGGLGHRGGPAD